MNRKLWIIPAVLFLAICIVWIAKPNSGTVVENTTKETAQFQQGDVVIPTEDKDEDIPDNYVAVAGYDDVYKVMDGKTCVGYKQKTSDGKYVDFDINMPSYFEKVSGSDTVYAEKTSDNKILRYRQFNGKEWDIVDKNGKVIFAIPDNYKRYDLSKEIYTTEVDGKTIYKQLVRFEDGSHGWQTLQ